MKKQKKIKRPMDQNELIDEKTGYKNSRETVPLMQKTLVFPLQIGITKKNRDISRWFITKK